MGLDKKNWVTPLENCSKNIKGEKGENFILIDFQNFINSREAIIEMFSSLTFDGKIWKEKWLIKDVWLIDSNINDVKSSDLTPLNHGDTKKYYKFDKLGPWGEKQLISWESILDTLTIPQLKLIKTSLSFYFDRKNSNNNLDSYSSRLIEHVISLCVTLIDKKKTSIYKKHFKIEIIALIGTMLTAIAALITAIIDIT
ncbi:MAG: hypothetical protein ACOQNY_01500 [Mycoplasmoidaceae bacterium]